MNENMGKEWKNSPTSRKIHTFLFDVYVKFGWPLL